MRIMHVASPSGTSSQALARATARSSSVTASQNQRMFAVLRATSRSAVTRPPALRSIAGPPSRVSKRTGPRCETTTRARSLRASSSRRGGTTSTRVMRRIYPRRRPTHPRRRAESAKRLVVRRPGGSSAPQVRNLSCLALADLRVPEVWSTQTWAAALRVQSLQALAELDEGAGEEARHVHLADADVLGDLGLRHVVEEPQFDNGPLA